MRRVLGALKSVYDFFTGDAVMLAGTVAAFAAASVLVRTGESRALAAGAFILLIVAGLVATLVRELTSPPR